MVKTQHVRAEIFLEEEFFESTAMEFAYGQYKYTGEGLVPSGCILLKQTYGEQTNHSNTGSVEALLPMTALFFLFINVKMPTIVGILTFMRRKNFMLS